MKWLSHLFLFSIMIIYSWNAFGGSDGSVVSPDTRVSNSNALLGVLDYKGGLQNLSVVFSARSINSFQLKVPSSCGLDILDVEASIEGVEITATVSDTDKNVYSVNNGLGSVIDKITVSLNAAGNLHCRIPVYVVDPTTSPGEPGTPVLRPGRYIQVGTFWSVGIDARGVIEVQDEDHTFGPEYYYPTGDGINYDGYSLGESAKIIVTGPDSFKNIVGDQVYHFHRVK